MNKARARSAKPTANPQRWLRRLAWFATGGWWSVRLRWFVGIIGYGLLVLVPIINVQLSFFVGAIVSFLLMGFGIVIEYFTDNDVVYEVQSGEEGEKGAAGVRIQTSFIPGQL